MEVLRSPWDNFTLEEIACQHCGDLPLERDEFIQFMNKVQELRIAYGKPMKVTSGYRCSEHPIELKKSKAGQHYYGAVDILINRTEAYKLLKLAMKMGFTGIGVSQQGSDNKRFLHLDCRDIPTIWSY